MADKIYLILNLDDMIFARHDFFNSSWRAKCPELTPEDFKHFYQIPEGPYKGYYVPCVESAKY